MPLIRLNDSAFDAQLEGVYFGMWNGSSTVRCFVTRAALTDKAQGSGQAENLDVFHEYRSVIENLASAKYDAGKITSDGLVVFTRGAGIAAARNFPSRIRRQDAARQSRIAKAQEQIFLIGVVSQRSHVR